MRTFRSLRHRNYRLYFFGQLVSLVGSWTQMTALMWLAHEQTGEAKWPAFLAAVQIGPTFFLGPWGGGLADRVPKRALIVRTQFGFLTTATALLALYSLDALSVWAMLIVMFAHGIVQAIDLPARLAFIPSLVDRADLYNAVALNSLLFNLARAAGPALAGLLMVWGGTAWCFAVNAVSYVAVLAALAAMRLPAEAPRPPTERGGFRVLADQPNVLTVILVAGLVAIGGWSLLPLLPSFADGQLGHAVGAYGTLLSAVGVGALGAALVAATFGHQLRRKRILVIGLATTAIALAGLARAGTLSMATIACGLFGFGMILFFATGQTVVQLSAVDAHRGKVMGIWAMMLSAGVPLGNLVFGPAADAFGVTNVIAVQAVVILLATGLLATRRVE